MNPRGKRWSVLKYSLTFLIVLLLISQTGGPLYHALAQAPPTGTPGLVAYYPFDGDTRDYSGNGNHGTNSGAIFVAGKKGQALKFDGVNNYVSAPVNINPEAMPRMTMVAWVQADKVTGTVISHDNGDYDRTIDIDNRGGGTGWSAFSGSGAVLGYRPVTIGEWVFIAAVYDQNAKKVRLHVDDAVYEKAGTLGSGWNYINIGRNPSFGGTLAGTIDEVRIYNYALSAGEIATLRAGVGSTTALVPASTSIVANGDFEDPGAGASYVTRTTGQTFGGWTVDSASIDHISGYWQAASGRQSVDLSGDSAGAIRQDLSTIPGQAYILRFAIAGNPAGTAVKQMEVLWGAASVDKLSFDTTGRSTSSMGWQEREYALTATASVTRLTFRGLTAGASGAALDNVRVTASIAALPLPALTPPPAVTPTPAITPIPALRQTDAGLIAESRVAASGGTVTVPIRLERASKVGSLNFSISYAPQVLKVVRVDGGDLGRGALFQANTRDNGVIRFGVATQGTDGVTGDGPVAHIVFTVAGAAGARSSLTLGDMLVTDTGGTRLGLKLQNGSITIGTKVKGDYDGDGRLTAKDALAALKMSVKDLPEDVNLDMDNDGRVSAEDARLLLAAALSGQGTPGSSSTALPVPQPTALNFGNVLDSSESSVSGSGGGLTLQGGSVLTIPARAIDGDAKVRLMRAAVPDIVGKADLLSDVYYLAATGRPSVMQDFSLNISYDKGSLPQGMSEDSIRAYALVDRTFLYPVSGVVQKNSQAVSIKNPEVAVLDNQAATDARKVSADDIGHMQANDQQTAPRLNVTGYVLGKPTVAGAATLKCQAGTPGEVHEEDNQVFRILFLVRAPCSLAKFVSDTLTEAYGKYNATYSDSNGKPPFARLSPDNRMVVQLGNFGGVNGEYKYAYSWNGWIQIDAQEGMRNQKGLRDTLFHEMFHAVQDVYSHMTVGGRVTRWWYESTAEWAGLNSRGLSFSDMVQQEFSIFPYVLSVPIQESNSYNEGLVPYGYALLIDHVVHQKPAYLSEVLSALSSKTVIGQLYSGDQVYDHMVASGRLTQTYPDFVKDVVLATIPYPGLYHPWAQGGITETDAETRISRDRLNKSGERTTSWDQVKDQTLRARGHTFSVTMPPLTTLFFTIRSTNLTEATTVGVSLNEDGAASDNAWLITTLGEGMRGPQPPPSRTGFSPISFPGLGKNYASLWVAVFNPDPDTTKNYDLTINLKKDDKPTPEPAAGPVVYKLQGRPAQNYITDTTAPGFSFGLDSTGGAMYSHPDTAVGSVTKTVIWTGLPQEIRPGQDFAITFKSSIRVQKADKVTIYHPMTGVESWQRGGPPTETYASIATSEASYGPFLRALIGFSPVVPDQTGRPGPIFQYSPNSGNTWMPTLSTSEAWNKYGDTGSMQQLVFASNGIWSAHVDKYSPPSATKPLPLETAPVESRMQFRLRSDFKGDWPDKVVIVVEARAGVPGGSGRDGRGTITYTYVKQ